jgi:hypothetical protein
MPRAKSSLKSTNPNQKNQHDRTDYHNQKNAAENVDEQPWTVAFEKRSTEAFEAALAPDVVLNASALVKPSAGRDLVKICMGTASTMYEHLAFIHSLTHLSRKGRNANANQDRP